MKTFATSIHALDPLDGNYKEFSGPNIQAPSSALAFEYCQNNGLGYCHIDGEIISEIPCDEKLNPEMDKKIDFQNLN